VKIRREADRVAHVCDFGEPVLASFFNPLSLQRSWRAFDSEWRLHAFAFP
jgi:hypothetical protein